MKKSLVAAICLCLSFLTLVGCTPASSIIKDTTAENTGIFAAPGEDYTNEPKDYVIKSKKFAFYLGEYLYFFGDIINSFGSEALEEFGYTEGVSLKEQTVKGHDMTWFEFIDAITMEKLRKILVACEYAAAEKTSYITEAKSYIEIVKNEIKHSSDGNPDAYIKENFGNGVSYQSYLNALQMEYIYDLYYADLYRANMDILTDAEVSERAGTPEGKDVTPIRNIVYIIAESRSKAEEFIAELGNTVTKEAVNGLADVYGLDTVEDYIFKGSEAVKEIAEWTCGAGNVGESSVVKLERDDYYEYCAVFYFGEGEATYLFEARLDLAGEKTASDIENSVSAYSDFTVDETILEGINF